MAFTSSCYFTSFFLPCSMVSPPNTRFSLGPSGSSICTTGSPLPEYSLLDSRFSRLTTVSVDTIPFPLLFYLPRFHPPAQSLCHHPTWPLGQSHHSRDKSMVNPQLSSMKTSHLVTDISPSALQVCLRPSEPSKPQPRRSSSGRDHGPSLHWRISDQGPFFAIWLRSQLPSPAQRQQHSPALTQPFLQGRETHVAKTQRVWGIDVLPSSPKEQRCPGALQEPTLLGLSWSG